MASAAIPRATRRSRWCTIRYSASFQSEEKKLQNLENISTVSSVSEGNILHLSDYEYKSLPAQAVVAPLLRCCSIEIAGCIYRILRPSLIFLLEEGRNATQVEVVLKLEKKLEIF